MIYCRSFRNLAHAYFLNFKLFMNKFKNEQLRNIL